MRTNIVLDDNLVKQAFEVSHFSTKKKLITVALEEFVRNHNRMNLKDLRGKISFRKDYDYKMLRKGGEK